RQDPGRDRHCRAERRSLPVEQAQRQGHDRRLWRLERAGMGRERIKHPHSAQIGEGIEIKTLISHPPGKSPRQEGQGKTIPRSIINSFKATYAGTEVLSAELHPGVSANPYFSFFMKVPGPGEFEFTWVDDAGAKVVEKAKLNVV